METCNVVLTFKSVDEILWCDHSNETSSAVLLHGTICFFNILQNKIWDFPWTLIFGTLGSKGLRYDGVAKRGMASVRQWLCRQEVRRHTLACTLPLLVYVAHTVSGSTTILAPLGSLQDRKSE